jgi:hypothetical protein
MKEPHRKGIANHLDPKSCAGDGSVRQYAHMGRAMVRIVAPLRGLGWVRLGSGGETSLASVGFTHGYSNLTATRSGGAVAGSDRQRSSVSR